MTGEQFKAELARMGISQAWLARQLGTDPVSINRWCAGKVPVPKHAVFCLQLLRRQFNEDWRTERDQTDKLLAWICDAHASGRSCPLVRIMTEGIL